MKKKTKAILTEGNVTKQLMKLSFQMFFGMLATMMFNIVDTYFVGQLGTTELAAMSFTFPVVMVVAGIATGLGVGASAIISKAIGEGDQYKIQRLTTDSLVLSLIIVACFIFLGLFTIEPVFTLIGANAETLGLIKDYMLYWYPGMFFLVIPMVGNSAIRASGDTKTASIVMVSSVAVNILLDPIFIFGFGIIPRLELTGAAIATVISRALTLVLSLYILKRHHNMITFKVPKISEVIISWKKLLYIGIPTAGTNLVVPLAMGFITALVASFGKEAVAAFGVASRVEMLFAAVIISLSVVLGPYIGQNQGAGKIDRVRLVIKRAYQFGISWGICTAVILMIIGKYFASLFNDDLRVIEIASLYFAIVSWGYGFQSILRISQTAFNVLNKPFNSTVLMILQMFILYVPLAYLGSYLLGVKGIFASALISNLLAGLTAYFWLRIYLKKDEFINHH
ncbi:MAG: MATE family efflux transporter [Melioribacteraceae bacterium]|nr:MATE family efflux transporter [Melioribacteraceae bacterium]